MSSLEQQAVEQYNKAGWVGLGWVGAAAVLARGAVGFSSVLWLGVSKSLVFIDMSWCYAGVTPLPTARLFIVYLETGHMHRLGAHQYSEQISNKAESS